MQSAYKTFGDSSLETKVDKEHLQKGKTKTKLMNIDGEFLKKFQTRNRFEVLIGNQEEEVKHIIKRNQLLDIPKKLLKKCKRCNYKKRNCIVNPSTCNALKRCCFKCKKLGHYPQSPRCKANKNVQPKTITKTKKK